MATYGEYCLVQVVPEPNRGERVNVGVLMVHRESGSADLVYDAGHIRKLLPGADLEPYVTFLGNFSRRLHQTSLGDSWVLDDQWLRDLTGPVTPNLIVTPPGAVRMHGTVQQTAQTLFRELVSRPPTSRPASITAYKKHFQQLIESRPDLAQRLALRVQIDGPLGMAIEIDAVARGRVMVRIEGLNTEDAQDRLLQLYGEVILAREQYEVPKDSTLILFRPPKTGRLDDVIKYLESAGKVMPVDRESDIDPVVDDKVAALALAR